MKRGTMTYIFMTVLLYGICAQASDPTNQPFLNPEQLKDTKKTQQRLLSHGFKKIFFMTQDKLKLCGLFLDKHQSEKTKGTIIYCAGFYPGTKEGMSSFYTLIADQPYNVLLFDARGHQESEGTLLTYSNLKQYGSTEYQDIIAAITFVQKYNTEHNINTNIIIHGICSGAFNTAKALEHMTQHNDPNLRTIKGIIFDSGWLQLQDIVESTINAELDKRFKNSYFSWVAKPLSYILNNFYLLTLKHYHTQLPGIEKFIQTTTIPIWFVHCINDPYVPIQPVQKCTQQCRTPRCWWIEYNSHASYHMKHHQEYQAKLLDFLQQIQR